MQVRVLKDGLFRIKLPTWVAEDINTDEVCDETQAGAIKKYEAAIKAASEARKSVRKVIMTDYRVACRIWDQWPLPLEHPDDNPLLCDAELVLHGNSPDLNHSHQLSFNSGGGLTVYAQVYEETTIKLEGNRVLYKYKYVPSTIPPTLGCGHGVETPSTHQVLKGRPAGVIEWTEEAEAFFSGLGHQLDTLILAIHRFLGQKPELIESTIQTGRLPLLGGPTDERPQDSLPVPG